MLALSSGFSRESTPIPLASSGLVYLAFNSPAMRTELEALIRQTYPDLRLDVSLIEAASTSSYAFSPRQTREQSLGLPVFMSGKVAAVPLMMFMSRVHGRAAVLRDHLPRLQALRSRRLADRAQRPPQKHRVAVHSTRCG